MTVDSQLALLESRMALIEKRLDLLDRFSAMVTELGTALGKMQETLNTLMLQNQELDVRLDAFTAAVKGQKYTVPGN